MPHHFTAHCFLPAAIAVSLAQFSCGKPVVTVAPSTVTIENEQVYIAPLAGLDDLAKIPGWPSDSGETQALLKDMDEFHTDLLAEFRRCEKYGLYTVADSSQTPTVVVTPHLDFEKVKGDSLFLVLYLVVENKANGKKFNLQIKSAGIFDSRKKANSGFHRVGLVLLSYRKNFPFRETVSCFYSKERAQAK
jgi:hypothetical protein